MCVPLCRKGEEARRVCERCFCVERSLRKQRDTILCGAALSVFEGEVAIGLTDLPKKNSMHFEHVAGEDLSRDIRDELRPAHQ